MRVNGFGKMIIAVGNPTYKEVMESMKNIDSELTKLGIKCKLYLRRRLIITKHVIIKFILKKQYYRYNRNVYGVKADGCYGFNTIEAYNITNGKNPCNGIELIDYILGKDK